MTTLVEVGLSNAVAALVLAVVALLAGLCRLRPAVVHALWLLVLLKLVTPPLLRIPVPVPLPAAGQDELSDRTSKPVEQRLPPAGAEADTPEPDVIALPPLREELVVRAGDEGDDDVQIAAAPTVASFPWTAWLGGVWLVGAALWFGIAAVRLWRFGRLLRVGRPAPGTLLRRIARLSKRVELASPPEVRVLPGRLAPMIWGAGTPLLLLPESLEDQVGQDGLDTLLLHELSHLKRGDHLVRWLEFIALGLYWWLPVAWYARRELREAEEQCCDAWVVRTMPGARKLYATALVEALDFLSQPVTATPPLASALGQVADLKRRLTMIMRGTTPHLLGRPFGLAVFGLAFAVLPLVPGLGLGQSGQTEREEERKDVIRFVADEDTRKLQEEIRRKKEEIEALARKLEQAARQQADVAKKKAQELSRRISRETQGQFDRKPGRNVIVIEISGEAIKGDELKEVIAKIEKAVDGKNVTVKVLGEGKRMEFFRGGDHVAPKTVAPKAVAPKAPKAPTPFGQGERDRERGARGGEGDRRIDGLEKRLESILKELESLRKEMRAPAKRGGNSFSEFSEGFGRKRESAPKADPKPRPRDRSSGEAK